MRWRWVVGFIPHPLETKGKNTHPPLNRRLRGTQSQFGYLRDQRSFLSLPEIESWIIQPVLLELY
jgi:hypothetical protein